MKAYAVVLTHNRQQMAVNLLGQLVSDGIQTFVLDHNSIPTFRSVLGFDHLPGVYVRRVTDYLDQDFNISALWNIGLDWVRRNHAHSAARAEDYCVTVFNDDASISPHFCRVMAEIMETHDVDVVSSGSNHIDKSGPRPISLGLRPQGWAWTVRGSSEIRVDESMKIWYSDDDLWQQALSGRGYALTSSANADNRDADGNFVRNPWWQEQAGRDRETFKNKWGYYSW